MPHASLTDVANEDLGVGPTQSDDVVRDGARAHVYIRLDVARPSEIPLHHLLAEDTGSGSVQEMTLELTTEHSSYVTHATAICTTQGASTMFGMSLKRMFWKPLLSNTPGFSALTAGHTISLYKHITTRLKWHEHCLPGPRLGWTLGRARSAGRGDRRVLHGVLECVVLQVALQTSGDRVTLLRAERDVDELVEHAAHLAHLLVAVQSGRNGEEEHTGHGRIAWQLDVEHEDEGLVGQPRQHLQTPLGPSNGTHVIVSVSVPGHVNSVHVHADEA
jgi:hypothetical protein